ncbi:Ubiquinone/menaquinone biosynthesis C-methyltransferase UbiE [Aquicella siphonis]|uniref:Ubiquinone/menaquinone biosynthesis C-methyltransferase UbiE n=1 Tax=Aquicella siphonis TaxID=254247 RepID=A0A5E4PEQ0_9COXI|nr:methyltransferase domain-containing protein [Aquicella siphonis]VVC75459.1 Ubiquinone/menaquinone biosynthesis C-methyltransferase UbiE [Aquicella siphonis]
MLKILAVVIALVIFTSIIWRLLSRRHALPCPTWLSWMVEMDNPFTKVNRAAVIIECLNLKPDMTLLDAGCGPGRISIPASRLVKEVVAMDIQTGMLQRVQQKAKNAGISNIQYLHAGLGEGKLDINRFDRAVLVTVLGEIPNRLAALKEIFHALKPGGILSVTEIIFDPHFQRRKTVLDLAKTIGFREKSRFGNSIAYTLHLEKPE